MFVFFFFGDEKHLRGVLAVSPLGPKIGDVSNHPKVGFHRDALCQSWGQGN